MKTLILNLFLLCQVHFASAQIEYHSAMDIRMKCVDIVADTFNFKSDPSDILLLSSLLRDFLPDSIRDDELTADQVFDHYKDNPFFGNQIKTLAGGSSGLFAGLISNRKSGPGALSGLDVTNLAHGLSQFMIERAKQELTVAFFNRFKNFAEKHEEFAVLFPVTTDNLDNLLAHHYPDMLPALRSGFLEDIKSITYHLDDVLELPKYQELLQNFPEVKVAIRSIRVVHELEAGSEHPAELFEKFASFGEWDEPFTSNEFRNFGGVVKLANILSGSLRNLSRVEAEIMTDSGEATILNTFPVSIGDAWISFEQVKQLVMDDVSFKIYLGLFYQSVKREDIQFYHPGSSVLFTDILVRQKDNLFLFENKVTEFIELANKVDNTLDTLKEKRTGSVALSNDELYSYIDVSLDVIEYGFSLGKLFAPHLEVDQYCLIARKANELYRNIYKQEYTQAISNAADILDEVNHLVSKNRDGIRLELDTRYPGNVFFKKPVDKLSKDEFSLLAGFNPTSPSEDSKELLAKYKALQNSGSFFTDFNKVIARTTRYGLFMANMVKAESADEVSALLESTVLPVGSSSIKKNSGFNMAIQSYLGGFGALNAEDNDESSWNTPFGVIAPVGLALSAGLPKKFGSVSLFLPLLDIGAVVDYQLKGNTIPSSAGMDSVVVTKDYSIKLGQILSPGAYFVWGLPWDIPLSLGIGTQYGPGLGKLDETGSAVVNNPRWRTNVFLAVDIPFFNLVNVPKTY